MIKQFQEKSVFVALTMMGIAGIEYFSQTSPEASLLQTMPP